ncbi:MAG: hypothetical protein CL609_16225 [Anaerolineaceae bacterium]|nr:hypothetical protein [Anaerolineaceae bacterium]
MNNETLSSQSWLEKPISDFLPKFSIEKLIIVIILILAVFSRLYDVGARVMSHDEVNHVVPSYDLSIGKGYRQDPVTHGPLQFHLIALSYFMFGDSDFTARFPAALASIATIVVVVLAFRRYLGRWGHIIGGVLFLISPYLLFYGRYTRNEAFVGLFSVLILYATLRYLDRGDGFSLTLLTVAHALNFTAKETAYIYIAQLLLFLVLLLYFDIISEKWDSAHNKNIFSILTIVAILFFMSGLGFAIAHAQQNPVSDTGEVLNDVSTTFQTLGNLSILLAIGLGILAIIVLFRGLGQKNLHKFRSFDLLMLNGTLVLPLLTAFPIKILGSLFGTNWNPLDYSASGISVTGITLLLIFGITAFLGIFWNKRLWIKNTIIFWAIFIVFYTTFFTNAQGFFTGLVGSLGYWLDQQAVNRGTQPLYYYVLLQVPFYEYLAAAGTFLAAAIGIRFYKQASLSPAVPPQVIAHEDYEDFHPENQDIKKTVEHRVPVLLFLLFWSITSLVAYSLAGERMPWLTVHIAVPLLLTAAWGLNKLIEMIPWIKFKEKNSWMFLILLPMFVAATIGWLSSISTAPFPFSGKSLEALQSTSKFLLSIVGLGISIGGFYFYLRSWKFMEVIKLLILAVFILLTGLTARTAYTATYINYDNAKEFLVYAHAARGPKDILEQVEEISERTVGDKNIVVAYDNDSLYPYWWYFRDYPNKIWYTDKPTRDLLNAPVILASNENFSKVDALTKGDYISFDYKRLWWPMQDYYFLTWDRIQYAITNPEMRSALFDIWLNRDYEKYAEIKGRDDLTLTSWQPSDSIRMYVRNDVAAMIWNYGALPVAMNEPQVDPYEDKMLNLMPDQIIGNSGIPDQQLLNPRGLAVASDGSIYVADAGNNRIMHFNPDGTLINTWGTYANSEIQNAPGGTFYEPWGIAFGPDGSVFVTDTWNHRVQRFTSDGQFITEWGFFGTADSPDGFWGPRGIAVDDNGRVFVADTGNKRIAVYDSNGEFITSFGQPGFELGELDEPVGIGLGLNGEVYVADTWNQRIQVFVPDEFNTTYFATSSWDINGWFGQSLENKPFMGIDNAGNVFVTDPEGYRILGFSPEGTFLYGWGNYSADVDGFGLPSSIAFDQSGGAWVADAENNVLLHFTLPTN